MKAQFIHLESFSFSKSKSKSNHNQNIKTIVAEARRDKNACAHVATPKVPVILLGNDFDNYESNLYKKISNSKDILGRKVNVRTHILLAGVASYPVEFTDINCKVKLDDLKKWLRLTILFLKNEFRKNLDFIVLHKDEKQPHVHFYASPSENQNFNLNAIHPGKIKQSKVKFSKTNGAERKKSYNQGLKEFQNRYYEQVSLQCNHQRFNKNKGRLNRKEWLEEKTLREAYNKKIQESELLNKNLKIKFEQSFAKKNAELEQSYANKEIELEQIYNTNLVLERKKNNQLLQTKMNNLQKDSNNYLLDLENTRNQFETNLSTLEFDNKRLSSELDQMTQKCKDMKSLAIKYKHIALVRSNIVNPINYNTP